MYQLTYTSCKPGMSVNGSGGYTVRAASIGIDPIWPSSAPQLARCDLTTISGEPAPVRLGFQRHKNTGIITHTVRTLDHDARVSSFTHAVFDTGGLLGPREAISAWDSRFWKRANDEGGTDLPLIDSVPSGESLHSALLQRRVEELMFAQMASFAVSAWLYSQKKGITLVASDNAVAEIVWLLAHSLPAPMLRDFSFATNDHDPKSSGLALAGMPLPSRSLSPASIDDRHWFSFASGDRTKVPNAPYAEWVIRETLEGRWKNVGDLVQICDQLDIANAPDLELLRQVVHESYICTEADLLRIKDRPKLLRWLLQDRRHSEVAVAVVSRAPAADRDDHGELTKALCEDPARLNPLIERFLDQAAASVRASNSQAASYWINLCRQNDPATSAVQFWGRLTDRLDSATLTIQMRGWLATRLKVGAATEGNRVHLRRLLTIRLEELAEFLLEPLDADIKAEASRIAVDHNQALTRSAISALSRQQDVLARLLRVVADPMAVASGIAAHELLAILSLLAMDAELRQRIDLRAVLDYAVEAGQLRMEDLPTPALAQHWSTLLASRHAARFLSDLLATSFARIAPIEMEKLLRMAYSSCRLPSPLTERIERRMKLVAIIVNPPIRIDDLDAITAAVAELPEADRRTVAIQLLPYLLKAVAVMAPPKMSQQLQSLLNLTALHATQSPALVLREFATTVCDAGRLLCDSNVATTTLAHAFGAVGKRPLHGPAHDQMLDLGVELMELYSKAGGPVLNRQLTDQASRWPEPARSFFRLASQQHQVSGRFKAFLSRRHASLPAR